MKVVWTKLAVSDLWHIRNYIEADHPEGVGTIMLKIEKAVEHLPSYPNLGRPGRVKGTREIVVMGTPFLIPYRLKKERLEILAVIHSARRWPESF